MSSKKQNQKKAGAAQQLRTTNQVAAPPVNPPAKVKQPGWPDVREMTFRVGAVEEDFACIKRAIPNAEAYPQTEFNTHVEFQTTRTALIHRVLVDCNDVSVVTLLTVPGNSERRTPHADPDSVRLAESGDNTAAAVARRMEYVSGVLQPKWISRCLETVPDTPFMWNRHIHSDPGDLPAANTYLAVDGHLGLEQIDALLLNSTRVVWICCPTVGPWGFNGIPMKGSRWGNGFWVTRAGVTDFTCNVLSEHYKHPDRSWLLNDRFQIGDRDVSCRISTMIHGYGILEFRRGRHIRLTPTSLGAFTQRVMLDEVPVSIPVCLYGEMNAMARQFNCHGAAVSNLANRVGSAVKPLVDVLEVRDSDLSAELPLNCLNMVQYLYPVIVESAMKISTSHARWQKRISHTTSERVQDDTRTRAETKSIDWFLERDYTTHIIWMAIGLLGLGLRYFGVSMLSLMSMIALSLAVSDRFDRLYKQQCSAMGICVLMEAIFLYGTHELMVIPVCLAVVLALKWQRNTLVYEFGCRNPWIVYPLAVLEYLFVQDLMMVFYVFLVETLLDYRREGARLGQRPNLRKAAWLIIYSLPYTLGSTGWFDFSQEFFGFWCWSVIIYRVVKLRGLMRGTQPEPVPTSDLGMLKRALAQGDDLALDNLPSFIEKVNAGEKLPAYIPNRYLLEKIEAVADPQFLADNKRNKLVRLKHADNSVFVIAYWAGMYPPYTGELAHYYVACARIGALVAPPSPYAWDMYPPVLVDDVITPWTLERVRDNAKDPVRRDRVQQAIDQERNTGTIRYKRATLRIKRDEIIPHGKVGRAICDGDRCVNAKLLSVAYPLMEYIKCHHCIETLAEQQRQFAGFTWCYASGWNDQTLSDWVLAVKGLRGFHIAVMGDDMIGWYNMNGVQLWLESDFTKFDCTQSSMSLEAVWRIYSMLGVSADLVDLFRKMSREDMIGASDTITTASWKHRIQRATGSAETSVGNSLTTVLSCVGITLLRYVNEDQFKSEIVSHMTRLGLIAKVVVSKQHPTFLKRIILPSGKVCSMPIMIMKLGKIRSDPSAIFKTTMERGLRMAAHCMQAQIPTRMKGERNVYPLFGELWNCLRDYADGVEVERPVDFTSPYALALDSAAHGEPNEIWAAYYDRYQFTGSDLIEYVSFYKRSAPFVGSCVLTRKIVARDT